MSLAGAAAAQDFMLPSGAEAVPAPPPAASAAPTVQSALDIIPQNGEKWGHFNSQFGSPSSWAINIPPGGSISVCGGPQAIPTVKAVRAWAAAAGRDKDISVKLGCDKGYIINLQEYCDGNGTPAWAMPYNRTIKWCSSYMNGIVTPVVMHEVGHLWGLCDQYAEMNCDYNHRTPSLVTSSMMGASSPNKTKLTGDDVEGILRLASRPEAPSNALWKTWLSEQAEKKPDPQDKFQARAELLDNASYLRLSASGDISVIEVKTGSGWIEASETEARTGKDAWISKRLLQLGSGWAEKKSVDARFTFRDGSTAEKTVDLESAAANPAAASKKP